jgi:hypothetical protein
MNTRSFFFIIMAMIGCTGLLDAKAWKNHVIVCLNKTGANIGIITLDRPFKRSDVKAANLLTFGPDMQRLHFTRGRVLGWYQEGTAEFGILDPDDSAIVFVKHKGKVKALHGSLKDSKRMGNLDFGVKEIDITNTRSNDVTVKTKNPNRGEIDCVECTKECYSEDETLDNCECLNYCWDHTRDLKWRLKSGQTLHALLAEGTQVGIFEDVEDDEGYVCNGDVCDTTTTVTTTYTYENKNKRSLRR